MNNQNKNSQFLEKAKQNSNLSIQKYARQCYDYSSAKLDKIFLKILKEELQECGYQVQSEEAIRQLQRNPVLQTAHHTTPTNGPVFSAIDLISLLGLEEKYYLVGVFSGVPFSNSASSGCLSYRNLELKEIIQEQSSSYFLLQKEKKNRNLDLAKDGENRIRLIQSKFKDDLVFGSNFEKYRLDLWKYFTEKTTKIFPTPNPQESVSNWSMFACARIQEEIFQREGILYFDLCRVIKKYLRLKLQEQEWKYFFSKINDIEKKIHPIWFYTQKEGKKSWKIQPMSTQDLEFFQGAEVCFEKFQQFLKTKNCCPAPFLVFFVLAFLQGIRCLGSFAQILYLPSFEKSLKEIFGEDSYHFSHEWEKSFTSGKLTENGIPFYPMDCVFQNRNIMLQKYQNTKMQFLWNNFIDYYP